MTPRLLIVDDEELIRWAIKERLEKEGYTVETAETGNGALNALSEEAFDLLLLDYRLPDLDGLEVLKRAREADPDLLVILMTAYSTVESAVEAFRQGAYDYLNKPFNQDEMTILVGRALETNRLRREVRRLRAQQRQRFGEIRIIGESPAMAALSEQLPKVARSDPATVLIHGESGTGKELVAQAVHTLSPRADRPFVVVNCAALPDHLVESELFGHEKGAFTDAKSQKPGQLEEGEGGTIFLDEIGELPAAAQAKILRFLEGKTFRRVGGSRELSVDVRIVAATNQDLQEAVEEGRFREDLFYRLKILPLYLPPLRERPEDIAPLVHYYLDQFASEYKRDVRGITDRAMRALSNYPWPGNIRELKNVVERAVILGDGKEIGMDDLPPEVRHGGEPDEHAGLHLPVQGVNMEALEREFVRQALERTGGNQTQAARLLGMNRDQLRYRIQKYDLKVLE